MRDLRQLPKAHLHLHLEAGMSRETLHELAARQGMDVPQVSGYGSFTEFAAMYQAASNVLQTPADWEVLAEDIVSNAAEEGVVYVEPAFWATRYEDRFGPSAEVWDMVLEIFAAAARKHGVEIGWMAAVDRVLDSSDAACRVAELASELAPRRVVSFGLHNDEDGHPPGDFTAAFGIARDAGLQSTPHAGELDHGERVREAIEQLGAVRIGHGVRALEVPGLVADLAALGTCLDVCPTSNDLLDIVPTLQEHPLPSLLEAGVRCTVNADDPLLFSTTILQEFEVCREVFGFDDDTLAQLARTSIEMSSISDAQRTEALAAIDAWLGHDEPRADAPTTARNSSLSASP